MNPLAALPDPDSATLQRLHARLVEAAAADDTLELAYRALDLQLAHGFRREVLTHLRDIAYGSTASYATVAAATGHPKAVRAVGTACAVNPLPIIIPCHRVVRSDGSVGGYLGGVAAKQALLALEAHAGRGR